MISQADEFVLYDHVQYTKNDWRNRNKIKTQSGISWLTIPAVRGSLDQTIRATKVDAKQSHWPFKHLKSLQQNYSKAKNFTLMKEWLDDLYLNRFSKLQFINDINTISLQEICNFLEIDTKITQDDSLNISGDKNEKLINICKQLNADIYISGPAAKIYIDENLFLKEGITIEWMDYSRPYIEYQQLHGDFNPQVSILDLILNEGENAKNLYSKKEK